MNMAVGLTVLKIGRGLRRWVANNEIDYNLLKMPLKISHTIELVYGLPWRRFVLSECF